MGPSSLIVLVMVLSAVAQRPIAPPPQAIPEPSTRGKSTQHAIVVQGCVENGRLRIRNSPAANLPFDTLNVSEFILEGPKEMLRQIQEQHNRHDVEIQGVATVPPPPQDEDAAVVTSKKGPARITAGRRDEKSVGGRGAPRQITLRVASLTHVSEGCVARP